MEIPMEKTNFYYFFMIFKRFGGRRGGRASRQLDHGLITECQRGCATTPLKQNLEIQGSPLPLSGVWFFKVFEVFRVAVRACVVRAAIVERRRNQMEK